MAHSSNKAVVVAILTNGSVTILKFIGALISDSAAMLNAAVHSLMAAAARTECILPPGAATLRRLPRISPDTREPQGTSAPGQPDPEAVQA